MTEIDNFIKNVPGNGKFLYSAFQRYTNLDLLDFMHQIGVKTKLERGERVFPVSDDALEVVEKLKRELERNLVRIVVNSKVDKIIKEDDHIKAVQVGSKIYECDKVILATGGKSYPLTGSTGDGYKIASNLGHTVVLPKASLVPLEIYETKELQGLSLKNVSIKITDNGKCAYEDFGEMIFTHFGVSGPVILSGSSHLLRRKNIDDKMRQKQIKLHIDLKPALEEEKLDLRIQRDFEKYTKKQFKNSLNDLLPAKLIPYIIKLSEIVQEKQVDQISKFERQKLVLLLKDLQFTIKCFRPIEEAIVTAGGINIKEINSSTMESKLVKGLYFAGEIIDVDAYTGGFNLQIAFSTGFTAGQLL